MTGQDIAIIQAGVNTGAEYFTGQVYNWNWYFVGREHLQVSSSSGLQVGHVTSWYPPSGYIYTHIITCFRMLQFNRWIRWSWCLKVDVVDTLVWNIFFSKCRDCFCFQTLVFLNVPSSNRVQVQKCLSSYDTKDKFVTDDLEKETLPCLLKISGKRKLLMMQRYIITLCKVVHFLSIAPEN